MNKFIIICLIVFLGLTAFFLVIKEKNAGRETLDKFDESLDSSQALDLKLKEEARKNLNMKQNQEQQRFSIPVEIDKDKTYLANLNTSLGNITIQLTASQTPVTVNNFVYLSKKNFYNNTIFHRVIKGFMIQGGDPNGDGTGGPGYSFADEPFTGEYVRGTVAMANSGPNTNGSQFFIMQENYPLPKQYVIFGKVVSGMDTVDKIAESPVATNSESSENSKPLYPTVIKSVDIVEK